ncbi:MAG: DHHC zinc finger domain-containing protein [Limnothrix sp. RL_2_0]|nr:DHHC zinc finger domain-containing protein [Limnothrix sp. RL_2_0]
MAKIKLNKINQNPLRRPLQPQKTAEGYCLVDPNDGFNLFIFIFGLLWLAIWCGVSFPMFAFVIIAFIQQPSLETILPVAFLSIFAVIGVVGLVWAGSSLYRVYRIKVGEVILSTYPLYQGQSYRIKYRRKLRQGRTTKPTTITAQWVNYEWVEYRRGTDTVTATHEISVIDLPEQSIMAGANELTYMTQVTVPENAPLSIYAPHNQVRWELRVKIQLPYMTRDTSFFVLQVLPS